MPRIRPDTVFIIGCWAIFYTYWIAAAFRAKRTAVRGGWRNYSLLLLLLLLVVAYLVAGRRVSPGGGGMLWSRSTALVFVADAVTVIGLAIAVWARTILGGNWSSVIVVKEQHELVERGPYAYVRHPIYTGVLLMLIGTVIVWDRTFAVWAFGLAMVGLRLKAMGEERLLTEHFPDAYPRYRSRVRGAIVPYIL